MTGADPYAGRSGEDVARVLATRGPSDGYVRPEEMQAFLADAKAETIAAAAVAVAEVIHPGSGPDAGDREWYYHIETERLIGQPLSDRELHGGPVAGCVACAGWPGCHVMSTGASSVTRFRCRRS